MIGIGGYGWQLCRVIKQVATGGGCELVAAADNRLGQLRQRAEELAADGVELFDDATEMFTALAGRCDAVYICTSIPSHLPLTAAAVEAGYHVHLEKPPAATIQQADRIVQVVKQAGVLCTIGFHGVYGQGMRLLKDRLVSGRCGRVRTLTAVGLLPRRLSYYTRNDWAGRLKVAGQWVLDGLATNAMAHEINAMLFLAGPDAGGYGEPTSVRAELYAAGPIESHDTACIEIQTADGPTAWFYGSHCSAGKAPARITVLCDHARAVWTDQWVSIQYGDGRCERFEPDRKDRYEMVSAFTSAITAGDPAGLVSTPADARKTVAVCNAAYESSGTIHRIPPAGAARLDEDDDQARTVIDGIDDCIRQASELHCLFSDLDPAPDWAVAGEAFDLAGYDSFPRRFRCQS